MPEAKTYRATIKVHLGGAAPPTEIDKGDIITFDGQSVRRPNGGVIQLPNPGALNGAIRAGWLVPQESAEVDFQPKSAGVEVRSAVTMGREREQIKSMVVREEEQDIGSIADVRGAKAPPVHVAGDSQRVMERTSKASPTGAKSMEVIREGSSEGVVVGRMKTSAKSEAVEIGKGDRELKSKLDNKKTVSVVRVVATGDVQEARVGTDLQELLPEAASSGVPPASVFQDDGVTVTSTGTSAGGAEDGVVVGKVVAVKRTPPSKPEVALRQWVSTGESWDGEPVTAQDLRPMVKGLLRKLDAFMSAKSVIEEEVDIHGFQWDLEAHWKIRQMRIREHSKDPETLHAILAAEGTRNPQSPAVIKLAEETLAQV